MSNFDLNDNNSKSEKENRSEQSSLIIWISSIHDPSIEDDNRIQYIIERLHLSETEMNKIKRFVFLPDRKRSLLSLLLQHSLIMHTFYQEECPFNGEKDEIKSKSVISRDSLYSILHTSQGKPFARLREGKSYWNYNVSHHGTFVSIAASSNWLVGIDIVDTSTRSAMASSCEEYVNFFSKQLTSGEINYILQASSSEIEKYERFFLIWSLKEAFIKAIGLGLGFDLLTLEFSVEKMNSSATLRLNGKLRPDWHFHFRQLDSSHILSVARGPITDAIEEYKQLAWEGLPLNCASCEKGATDLPQIQNLSVENLLDIFNRNDLSNPCR